MADQCTRIKKRILRQWRTRRYLKNLKTKEKNVFETFSQKDKTRKIFLRQPQSELIILRPHAFVVLHLGSCIIVFLGKRAWNQFSNTDLNRYLFSSYYPIFFFVLEVDFLTPHCATPATAQKFSTVKVPL